MSEYVCETTDDYPDVPYGSDEYSGTVERRERVVRCRDCASWDADEGWCNGFECSTEPDGFCKWGVRR